ncbi:hypothetical protein EV426DRAFT_581787 [Tirmania nivea]|nr:hypothetical protein EV426DRAFT_581787 [Tirmania nivea]
MCLFFLPPIPLFHWYLCALCALYAYQRQLEKIPFPLPENLCVCVCGCGWGKDRLVEMRVERLLGGVTLMSSFERLAWDSL